MTQGSLGGQPEKTWRRYSTAGLPSAEEMLSVGEYRRSVPQADHNPLAFRSGPFNTVIAQLVLLPMPRAERCAYYGQPLGDCIGCRSLGMRRESRRRRSACRCAGCERFCRWSMEAALLTG